MQNCTLMYAHSYNIISQRIFSEIFKFVGANLNKFERKSQT